MARPKRDIEDADLSSPPDREDFFDALRQILTPSRKPAKGENREPTSKELNTKYRLRRKPAG